MTSCERSTKRFTSRSTSRSGLMNMFSLTNQKLSKLRGSLPLRYLQADRLIIFRERERERARVTCSVPLPHAQIQIAYAEDKLRPHIEMLRHEVILDEQRLRFAVVGHVGARGMAAGQKETLERHLCRILDLRQPIGLNLQAVHSEQLCAIVAGGIERQADALGVARCGRTYVQTIPTARKLQLAQLHFKTPLTPMFGDAHDA